MNYEELIASDIRLMILRTLAEDADYSHNEVILREVLVMFGHKISQDKLRSELAWLSEQGLVKTEEISGLVVAKLTARGADVSSGAAQCPGVKRPRPEA
uniref:ArsR family transcriptional regulator n=1 Tax=viral metagenome TaxID=1070528 RepID=A0A6H2A4L0_9ZZZZ